MKPSNRARRAGTWLLAFAILTGAYGFAAGSSSIHEAHADCETIGPPPDMELLCQPTATPTFTPTSTPTATPTLQGQ